MKQLIQVKLEDYELNLLKNLAHDLHSSLNTVVADAVCQAISQHHLEMKETLPCRFRFIDLFAGIGGMRIGFERAGGKCVYSNEWNKYSQKTYFANFGELPEGDITKVRAASIPDHDILVGGFPCQPFSIAGVSKKKSLGRATGFEDKTQGTLFFDICRILKENEVTPKS